MQWQRSQLNQLCDCVTKWWHGCVYVQVAQHGSHNVESSSAFSLHAQHWMPSLRGFKTDAPCFWNVQMFLVRWYSTILCQVMWIILIFIICFLEVGGEGVIMSNVNRALRMHRDCTHLTFSKYKAITHSSNSGAVHSFILETNQPVLPRSLLVLR